VAKVSVLIPTFNSENYIGEAIKSVLDQTFTDFELIILDNCSTDGSFAEISKYLKDSRITYYKNDINIGAINNFNKILQYGNGAYIKFLFSDDILLPDALEKFVNILDNYPNVSLVTSYFQFFGSLSYISKQPYQGLIPGQQAIRQTLIQSNWIGSPSNVIFRRLSYDKKGFNKKWKWWGDLELWHRILNSGDMYIIPEVLSKFKYHNDSATQGCIQRFEDRHDEYYYMKFVRDNKIYPSVSAEKTFQMALRERAVKWISLIPSFYKKRRYDLIQKAVYAIFKERLLGSSIFYLLKKVKRKLR